MPLLRQVLPQLVADSQYSTTKAYLHKDVRVVEVKLTSGAPCSSHNQLFASWPGHESGVQEWYILENGFAVGKISNFSEDDEFPVFNLQGTED